MFKKTLLVLLNCCFLVYQWFFSPFLSALFGVKAKCRFYPTCSCYAKDCLKKYGILKGSWLTIKRLAKCHPFSGGGIDYVP